MWSSTSTQLFKLNVAGKILVLSWMLDICLLYVYLRGCRLECSFQIGSHLHKTKREVSKYRAIILTSFPLCGLN